MKSQNFPSDSERLDPASAEAMVHALRGVHRSAARLHAQLQAKGPVADPDAGMVSAAAIARAARDAIRLPGIRDILVIGHPVVDRMAEALTADRERVPVGGSDRR